MTLYVNETGTPGAPTIVFLHGAGAGSWMWSAQTAALADFHCLTIDLPGHGKSNQVEWRSLTDTAEQVAALIHMRATDRRGHLVGLSLGAYVALALLEQQGDVVDRVVLSGVTAAPMPNRQWLNVQLGVMSVLMKSRGFVRMQARMLRIPADAMDDFTESLLAMSFQSYRCIFRELVDYTASPELTSVSNPTLVTAGGEESPIILAAVNTLPIMLPNAQGRIAPGLHHGWNGEAPDLFSGMVRAWITAAPLPDGLQVPQPGGGGGG